MGLYLCIFDESEEELGAVEVGAYSDWGRFIQSVVTRVEGGKAGTVCPTLSLHHDSDGEWTAEDCKRLLDELGVIAKAFLSMPVEPFTGWMAEVAAERQLVPSSLFESFIDVDGELLIPRLADLAAISTQTGRAISFQ